MAEHTQPRGSTAKQEALMKLMSSNPSLMNSFDDELLASITLASAPAASSGGSSSNKSAAAAAAKHTLIDPRLSYNTSSSTSSSSASRASSSRYSAKTERVNVCLYSEADEPKKPKKQVLLVQPHAVNGVSKSSSVAKNARTSSVDDATKAGDDKTRDRSNAVTRGSARYPQKLVSLLDESVFTERGTLKSSPQVPHQQPLPPSIAPVSRAKSISPSRRSNSSSNNNSMKAKANTRRRAQPTASQSLPMTTSVSVEQQYEFGRTTSYSSDSDSAAIDQSAVESTHSSSHGSNESDESCASMSSVSMLESHSSSNGNGQPSSSKYSRQKSSQMVLDHRCFVARDQWVDKSSRRSCSVCERDFGVWRKRHTCRMCGDVICSRCSVFRAVNLSVVEGKCRVCSCCSVSYRKKLDDLIHSTNATITGNGSEPIAPTATAAAADNGSTTPSQRSSSSSEPGQLTASSLSRMSSGTNADDNEDENASAKSGGSPLRSDSDLSTLLLSSDYSSGSLSSASDGLYSFSSVSSSRNIEEELEAALKARQLEKEVEASRSRIQELEVKIQEQENQKELLSTEQQSQLQEARSVIQLLQEKLRQQELSAREAAVTRDTICLTNLRQVESYSSDDEESRALKKKLKVLERQLQQAGINVAEVIPYEVAKAKVTEIARRLQEIGSSELVLDDKLAQAAARKEYYKLEQDMEKYNTALVMTDEYIDEQRRKDALFEDENRAANERALALLRSAIPVDISRLSEQQLKSLETPSGVAFSADLAKRLKRTNVLQLLRVDPKHVVRMHPSVIEGHRTTGLTLLERRALHMALQQPYQEWKRQQMDEMSQKKCQWFTKLRDALVSAVMSYSHHCHTNADPAMPGAAHSCKLLGLSCPVRAETKVEALYAVGLGFPQDAVYFEQEVIKSDPEGAGEKALQEAQSYAREVIANQRQRALKAHYKLSMREVAQAMGALEEIDALLERIKTQDAAFPVAIGGGGDDETGAEASKQQLNDCDALLQTCRELVLLLAKRAGICVVGKRNRENDERDTRSPVERQAAVVAVELLVLLLEDIREFYGSNCASGAMGTLRYVSELLEDVKEKNASALRADEGSSVTEASDVATSKRVPWSERSSAVANASQANGSGVSDASSADYGAEAGAVSAAPRIPARPAVLPTSASLFDAIRARKQIRKAESDCKDQQALATAPANAEETEEQQTKSESVRAAKPPVDLLAAIRARQSKAAQAAAVPTITPAEVVEETLTSAAKPPVDLLAAIRARQSKAAAVGAADACAPTTSA